VNILIFGILIFNYVPYVVLFVVFFACFDLLKLDIYLSHSIPHFVSISISISKVAPAKR
jgi:hypothetical protein